MALGFRLAVETDIPTALSLWPVMIPAAALPGDYLLAMLASPTPGIIWSAPGWTQLDAFSTVQFTLGGFAQPPPVYPISYAIFGRFLMPVNLSPSGTATATFFVGTAPTQVIGATPGSAAGVAMMAAYTGVNKAEQIRNRGLSEIPAVQITYSGGTLAPITTETVPPFTPVTAASVPIVFANQNDWLVCPLITPGSGSNIFLPGASFILRASTTGGFGIVIALADENVNQGGMQSGLQWTATSLPTPLIAEAIALWPDDGPYMPQEIRFYAALDRNPVHFGYDYSQDPTIIANSAGYLISVYAAAKEAQQSLFSQQQFSVVTLLVTRSDGSTFTRALTFSSDGYYAYCPTLSTDFPYTGRYYFQLMLQWANGAVQFSSQAYLMVRAQGGQ